MFAGRGGGYQKLLWSCTNHMPLTRCQLHFKRNALGIRYSDYSSGLDIQHNLEKEQNRGLALAQFQIHYKAAVMMTVLYWHKVECVGQ